MFSALKNMIIFYTDAGGISYYLRDLKTVLRSRMIFGVPSPETGKGKEMKINFKLYNLLNLNIILVRYLCFCSRI